MRFFDGSIRTARPAQAFGTIWLQGSEHERITRLALACSARVKSTGDCFEPRSIDQLAGHRGTFGAVGSPESGEISSLATHCDNADFLNALGRPQATANQRACVDHLRQRFAQGVDDAGGLLDGDGNLIGSRRPDVGLHVIVLLAVDSLCPVATS